MRTFQDNVGRTWRVTVDACTAKRVLKLTGVQLFGLVLDGGEKFLALRDDPVTQVDVLYAVILPQCARQTTPVEPATRVGSLLARLGLRRYRRGVTDEDFGRAMYGDELDEAWGVLIDETIDFFDRGRRRTLRATANQARLITAAMEATLARQAKSGLPKTCGTTSFAQRVARAFRLGVTRCSSWRRWPTPRTKSAGGTPPA